MALSKILLHYRPAPFRCAVHLFYISHPVKHERYSHLDTLRTDSLLTYPLEAVASLNCFEDQ
jgi:hypothetical protein